MNILFIGDIFGRPGRDAVKHFLPQVLKQYPSNLVLANCENAAGGHGMTLKIYEEFKALGIHGFTSGNHIWDKKEFLQDVDQCPDLLRPANYSKLQPGRGHMVLNGVAVINLAGRAFMGPNRAKCACW